MIGFLKSIRAIADLAMPRTCLACGKALGPDEEHLCEACMADLPQTHYWKLRENPMAESFNALIQKNMGEDVHYQPYSYASALFLYKGGCRNITKSLKYKRNFAAGRFFSQILGRTLAGTVFFRDVDMVVPIPLHWTRRRQRGYNQAEVIAREVARELEVPCEPGILKRARHTKTQTHLDVEGRSHNVSGAFRLSRTVPGKLPHHVLLIDDVFTTGATAAACEQALRGLSENMRISVATLACVEH